MPKTRPPPPLGSAVGSSIRFEPDAILPPSARAIRDRGAQAARGAGRRAEGGGVLTAAGRGWARRAGSPAARGAPPAEGARHSRARRRPARPGGRRGAVEPFRFMGARQSDGDTGASAIDAQVEDALAAAEFLRAQEGVDANRLGLLGFSLGGGVAVLAAAEHPDWFKALATWSTVGDFDADMKTSLGQETFDRAGAEGIVSLNLGWRTIALKAAFFDSMEAHSIADPLGTIEVPILAVAGAEGFSAEYAESLAAAGAEGSEAWIVPGADHIYGVLGEDQATAEEVIARTTEWFAQSL